MKSMWVVYQLSEAVFRRVGVLFGWVAMSGFKIKAVSNAAISL